MSTHTGTHLIFHKEVRNTHGGGGASSTIGAGPHSSSCTKLNSKCNKDLNERPDTLNVIEEKMGIVLNSLLQERTLSARGLIVKIYKELKKMNIKKTIQLKINNGIQT